MTTKADPYATKTQKRVDALIIVFTVLFILFALRISARGDTILSVAPQPFWSTLSLFKAEPKLSLVLVVPNYLTQGQPDYRMPTVPTSRPWPGYRGTSKGILSHHDDAGNDPVARSLFGQSASGGQRASLVHILELQPGR